MGALGLGLIVSTSTILLGSLIQTWTAMRDLRSVVSNELPGMILVIPAALFTNRHAYLTFRILLYPPWRRSPGTSAIQKAQGWTWINIGAASGLGVAIAAASGSTRPLWVVPLLVLPVSVWLCASYIFDEAIEMRSFFRGDTAVAEIDDFAHNRLS
jgi:hypothetical protein